MNDKLPRYPHEGIGILALAYLAGLANAILGRVKYGIRLVLRTADLYGGTDADWICVTRHGRRRYRHLDFTTGGKKTVQHKIHRSRKKDRETGRKVQIEPFMPGTNVSLISDPCFPEAYEALIKGAGVGREGTILNTTRPCPEHGNRCPARGDKYQHSFCEELLILGRQLHGELPRWARIPEGVMEEIVERELR